MSERDRIRCWLIAAPDLLSSLKLQNPSAIRVPRVPHIGMVAKAFRTLQIVNHLAMLSPCRRTFGMIGGASIERER